jgi:transposase-like protein
LGRPSFFVLAGICQLQIKNEKSQFADQTSCVFSRIFAGKLGMTPTKFSDSDKREIVRLYQQSDENTIALAKRYGVSSSTVRRILQSALSESEYEFLVQQKQKRLSADRSSVIKPTEATADASAASETSPVDSPLSESVPNLRQTTRNLSVSAAQAVTELEIQGSLQSDLDISDLSDAEDVNFARTSNSAAVSGKLRAMLPEAGLVAGEDFSDFDEDEDEDDDFDEDLEDEDSLFEGSLLGSISSGESILFEGFVNELRGTGLIQISPLSEASLPKICYLVVDRAAELITQPLKAFGELGQIPVAEIREKTLPVFDNHRVARRFATRNQRVFKIPDGNMLKKAAPYLQAKGITRLLIDGQVYSL